MERYLKPTRLDVDPSVGDADKQFRHWKQTFETFLDCLTEPNKHGLLINFVSPTIYESIAETTNYEDAMKILVNIYIKPKNEIFARHILSTCKQDPTESLDQFLRKLKTLARDCNFKAATADEIRDNSIRDAFISGLTSSNIRQRLLEKDTLTLENAFDSARSLEMAERHNQSFNPTNSYVAASRTIENNMPNESDLSKSEYLEEPNYSASMSSKICFFCGYKRDHPRSKCPAKDAVCKNCSKIGHFAKACLKKKQSTSQSAAVQSHLMVLAASSPTSLSKAIIDIQIDGKNSKALIDTGSSESFISADIVRNMKLSKQYSKTKISMATSNLTSNTQGHVNVNITYRGISYENTKLSILPNLCCDVILGHDFLNYHEKIEISFKGPRAPLSLCNFAAVKIDPPTLFGNLSENCKPIATKSRRFNEPDKKFISKEIQRLLQEDIIETSQSPWRAQVLVTSNERHKKRLVVDYSQTINRYTHLDAYPLPRIDQMIEGISTYKLFSTLDLQSAYHQIPLKEEEKKYTAFEADGNLYQFKRVPFGVTNGVAAFQRIIDNIIKYENLEDTFAYVDNVTVCGKDKETHDTNLSKFLKVADKYGLLFNESKSIISTDKVKLLGYEVKKGEIKPDPDRLQPLKDMSPPTNLKAQERIVGMFAYYSQWIRNFSDKAYPLIHNTTFPLPSEVKTSFDELKKELEDALLITIDPLVPLVVETDASDVAIAATLNQNGRPVAFFSRTLSTSEKNHSTVEKEAQAIVEACRKWKHYLIGNHFKLLTDQRSVAFMFDSKQKGKIKNEKIQRWRLELSCFKFDSVYRPGECNAAADSFSRMKICSTTVISGDSVFSECYNPVRLSANINSVDLPLIHDNLCHPGITRMMHFVRTKNLPFSLDDVKRVTSQCKACAETRPRYYKPPEASLIKATRAYERLSVDFKGPLPSSSKNKYLLTIIDEYSRFPFAFPCKDMTSSTIINCYSQLFTMFGAPEYIHSDRGSSFMSREVKDYLQGKGVPTSRSTPYNPQGNGQVERLNSTLWKAVETSLKSKRLPINCWEEVLPQALHSIRSLLCTATNATPHERFFTFNRKSETGTTLPTWLANPGTVLMKKNVKQSKYEPSVEEVELLESNPQYAHVRLSDGRETTVSVQQLAPTGVTQMNAQKQLSAPITDPNVPAPIQINESINIPSPDIKHNIETIDSMPVDELVNDIVDSGTNDLSVKPLQKHSYNLRPRKV